MRRSDSNSDLAMMAILSLMLILACSGGKNNDNDNNATTTTTTSSGSTTTDSGVVNTLAMAFPGSLALAVFPTSTAGASLVGDDQVRRLALTVDDKVAFDPNAKDLKEKVEEQEKIAQGLADSCLPDALGKQFSKGSEESCYEFDQDMIYGTNDTGQAQAGWLGTKDGKSSSGEACLVSFTRNQVSQVVAMVDQTLGFGMAAICQHKKLNPDVELPAVGSSIDLTPALENLFGDKIAVDSATLERLEDADAHPVYRILIEAEMKQDRFKRTVGIVHSPQDDENKEYSGTIFTVMEGIPNFNPAAQQPQAPQGQASKHQLLSIVYKRTETADAKTITADLRSGQFAAALAPNAINDAGVIDFNVGTNVTTATMGAANYGSYTGYSQSNDAVDGITFIAFSLDTDTNAGSLAYWKNPGGSYYENARGFNISIDEDETTGVLEGCATSGAASINFTTGISIRRYLNELEASNSLTLTPKGFWHPFFNSSTSSGTDSTGDYLARSLASGQNAKWYKPLVGDASLASNFTSQQDGPLITRQCFKHNATTGLYEIDTSKITAAAGFELIDTGNVSNAAKFIALPGGVRPPVEHAKPDAE